jgi:hypothetical protein
MRLRTTTDPPAVQLGWAWMTHPVYRIETESAAVNETGVTAFGLPENMGDVVSAVPSVTDTFSIGQSTAVPLRSARAGAAV